MKTVDYLDFDLLIEKQGKRYRARVLGSPAGEASAGFAAPFTDLELENFLLKIGRPRRSTRRVGSPEMEAAKALGGRLFDAVFREEINACWRSSVNEADRQNAGLRLRLRIANAPELHDLPWEFLYQQNRSRFLVLSSDTPLVRYLDLPEMIRSLRVETPLNVLVVIASASDFPSLDVEAEWKRLTTALDTPELAGRVDLVRLERPTLAELQRKLRKRQYHILHFVGHGGFDEAAQDGVLVFEDENGRGRLVSAQELGVILHDHRSLRLVVLNACEGSRSSRADPFAGTAQTLVQQGIPAVIAMQFEITDDAAITFAQEFYAAIADSYPVDAALAEARKAIFGKGPGIEWGTPVLYMRSPDGDIFDVAATAAAPATQKAPERQVERQIERQIESRPEPPPRPAATRPPPPPPEPVAVREKEPVAAAQPAMASSAMLTASFLTTYERYKKGLRNSRNASLVMCFLAFLSPIVVANDPSPDRSGALMPLFVFAGALFAMIQGKTRTLLATLQEQRITTEVLNLIAADEAFRAIQDRKAVEVFGKYLWDRTWLRITMAVSLLFTPIGLAILSG